MAPLPKPKKIDEEHVRELQELSDRTWDVVMYDNNQPMLTRKPKVVAEIPEMDTAYINLSNHDMQISAGFLDRLKEKGIDYKISMKGTQDHEVGHYKRFPREFYLKLFMLQQADSFGWKGPEIYGRYSDAVVNLDRLGSEWHRDGVAAMYRALAKDAAPLDRLMVALYQEMTHIDMGVDLSKDKASISVGTGPKGSVVYHFDPKKFEAALKKLKTLDYLEQKIAPDVRNIPGTPEWVHAVQLRTFGEAIKDLIPEGGSGGGGGGKGGKGGRCCDTGGMDDYTDADIDVALQEIARRLGKQVHDLVRRYVDKTRPSFQDPHKVDTHVPFAGIASAEINFHDDQIPFYKRWAASHRIYIADRPRKVNAFDAYPDENIPFESSDPVQRINRWSSLTIMPGITKKRKDAFGEVPEWGYRTPDLFCVLDTSGSMTHPNLGSYAVLTACVLGKNYHINGSNVGMMNFSADALILPPSRDLEQYYRAACAYWGGGTILNIERLKRLAYELSLGKDVKIEVTGEEDYDELMKKVEKLTPEQQQMVKEKKVTVKLDQKLREYYEKIDNVMITDGAIWNIEEVVDYLNEISPCARNTIFLVENPKDYEEWSNKGLKNTTIIHVNDEKDLVGVAMGKVVRRMANTDGEVKYWENLEGRQVA